MSTRLWIIGLIIPLVFLMAACSDGSDSAYADGDSNNPDTTDGDSSDPDLIDGDGGESDDVDEDRSNPDLPYEGEEPDIIDPTFNGITVHESQFALILDKGLCYLEMPISLLNQSRKLITVEAGLRALDGSDLPSPSGLEDLQIEEGRQTITLELAGACSNQPEDIVNFLLLYHVSWLQGSITGTVSYFALAPKLQVQLMGSNNLLEGAQTVFRIVAKDPESREAVKGAQVSLDLKQGDDVLQSAAFDTDEFGLAAVQLDVPRDLEGGYQLDLNIETGERGSQSISAPVDILRESRILLTTDKPFYQPGQTIHVRALALKVPHQRPLSDRDLTIEIEDSKGNKLFRETQTTGDYGVASTSFRLASLVNLGHYTIRASIDGIFTQIVSEKTITVDNYALPRFRIKFAADRGFYLPGESMSGSISSEYFYGKPVAAGQVHIVARKFDVEMVDFATIDGTLDEDGNYDFQLDLPGYFVGSELDQGKARVFLEISVTDSAAHHQVLNRSLKIVAEPVMVNLVPEVGRIIQGESQHFYLLLSDPAGRPLSALCTIEADGSEFEVTVGPHGMAIFEYTPENMNTSMRVRATISGFSLNRVFTFESDTAASYVMLRLDKALYEVGDTIRPRVVVANRPDLTNPPLLPDRVYLDIILNGQTRQMTTVELENGYGISAIDLDPDLAGPLELYAYYLTPEGQIIRDARVIFVRQANELAVSMTPSQEQYRPREDAEVTMQVSDQNGDPVQAGLGVTIVDEAVFALQDYQPGMERTYFQIEQEIMSPTYEIHGFKPGDLYDPEPEDPEDLDDRAQAYFAANGSAPAYGLNLNTYKDVNQIYEAVCTQAIYTLVNRLLEPYQSGCTPATFDVDEFVEYFADPESWDPWGNPMQLQLNEGHGVVHVIVQSAGPDEIFGTDDDIIINTVTCREYYPDGDEADGDMVFDGDWADGDMMMDGDSDAENSQSPSTHLRSWFPETLLVEPNLITDSDGTVDLSMVMPDSITTWRVTALANTMGGDLGSMTDGILVFQDFFVDIDFPAFLTQNDEVYLPLAIYNYLPEPQTIQLTAEDEDWFEAMDGLVKEVEVGPNQVTGVYFPIRVLKIGRQSMTLWAQGSEISDAVRREVTVQPDGVERTATISDWLDESKSLTLNIPETAIVDSEKLFVKVYPGILSQAIEGLDSMLRMPSGCFEQTSSSTYPNILVLQYLVGIDQLTPEIELKARDFITQGYQRLLTYEVRGGGFEWFGDPPAHTVLTCYGLKEFVDMAQILAIDVDLIPRTARWLAEQQDSDGSIPPSSGGISEGAINNYQGSVLRTTAYAAWALSRSEQEPMAISRAANYLLDHLGEADDTYTRALVAMALVSSGFGDDSGLSQLIADIMADRQEDGDGGYYWTQSEATETYSQGDNAVLETTALIGLMLLEDGSQNDTVQGIVDWLMRQKDAFGTWSTTQGTVLALRLMIASLGSRIETAEAVVTVSANGGPETELTITSENIDLMRLVDLTEQSVFGDNHIDIDFAGSGRLMYQATATWYVPGEEIAEEQGPLTIDVAYDRYELEVNDLVGVTVTIDNVSDANVVLVLVSVGLPPGFDLVPTKLDALIAQNGALTRYETTPHQIIFYLNEIEAGGQEVIDYELLARWPMEASTGEASAYPYYNPENKSEQESQVIVVSDSK